MQFLSPNKIIFHYLLCQYGLINFKITLDHPHFVHIDSQELVFA